MCTDQCAKNCFCHVKKKRPCDPFHCKCKAEACQNLVKRASGTSTAPETHGIEEEVKVEMGMVNWGRA